MLSPFRTIKGKYKGNFEKFIDYLYSHTFFTDKEKTMRFLTKPSVSALRNDYGFKVTSSIFSQYYNEYSAFEPYQTDMEDLEKKYLKARMEMYPDSVFYPDANFTMRMSYGRIRSYSPGDAAHYDAFSTLKGVIEKEDTSNFEFIVPERLKDLYRNKDFGQYGNNGNMPVCFITDNDITGGSSGSPVINSHGELIGLAFDGNWEAMSGDIAYEPQLQRCICVDVRYILFIIDKFSGNTSLLDELSIIQ